MLAWTLLALYVAADVVFTVHVVRKNGAYGAALKVRNLIRG